MRQSNPKAGRAPSCSPGLWVNERALWARDGNSTGRATAPPTTLNLIRQKLHSRPGAPSAPQPPRMWRGCLPNPFETPSFTKLSRPARRRACQRIHRCPPPRVSSPHCPPTRAGASRRRPHHRTRYITATQVSKAVQRPIMRPQARPTGQGSLGQPRIRQPRRSGPGGKLHRLDTSRAMPEPSARGPGAARVKSYCSTLGLDHA
jgi:hypothetical protein